MVISDENIVRTIIARASSCYLFPVDSNVREIRFLRSDSQILQSIRLNILPVFFARYYFCRTERFLQRTFGFFSQFHTVSSTYLPHFGRLSSVRLVCMSLVPLGIQVSVTSAAHYHIYKLYFDFHVPISSHFLTTDYSK